MASKTRYFVIASLLVLSVGLGTGLLAYYVGLPAAAVTRQGGPEALQYVPAEASMVAFADVHTVMTSPLREKLRSLLPNQGQGQQEFANQTGINLETDVDQVIAAASTSRTEPQNGSGFVLARGRFDVVRIEALMREHGGQVEEFQGKRLIVGNAPDGKHAVSLAFMEPGLIAVGGSDMVRKSVTAASGGANVTTNTELMNLVRDLDSGNLWAVGRFDGLPTSAGISSSINAQLPAIQWFSASAFVETGIRGVVRAQMKDEPSANNLRDLIRGMMALARLQSPSHPEIETALRTLDLGGTGNTVALSFEVPAELFDLLGSMAASRSATQR